MSVEEKRRELFEADLISKNPGARLCLSKREGGSYRNMYVQGGWEGFNAALDAVVIELPEVIDLSNDFGKGHFVGVMDVKKSIESTGLGLKAKA